MGETLTVAQAEKIVAAKKAREDAEARAAEVIRLKEGKERERRLAEELRRRLAAELKDAEQIAATMAEAIATLDTLTDEQVGRVDGGPALFALRLALGLAQKRLTQLREGAADN